MKKYYPYLPALFMDLCISSALTNTSFYSSYLHLSTSFMGIISSASALFFVCFAIPFGKASDRYGRTRVLYIASLLFAAVSLIVSRCKRGFSLAIVFSFIGISQALFWPAYEAWFADRHEEESLQSRIRRFNIFWSIGIMIGPFMSGHLYQLSPLVPFYVASIVSLGNIGIILLQANTSVSNLKVKQIETLPKDAAESRDDALCPSSTLRLPYLYIAWIANFSSWFTLGILRYLSPKMTIEHGIKSGTFGNLMLLMGIGQTLMFFYLGTKSSRKLYYRLLPLVCFQALALFALLLIWRFYNIYIWAIAFFMIGITVGMTYFSSLYYSLHGNLDKGGKSGLHEAIIGSGKLLGPFVGGIAADKFGDQSPYLICSMLYFVSIIGEIVIRRRVKQEQVSI